jgi:predicted Zn-dependent peptidase
MKLLLMGDFDPDQARALIEELFAQDSEASARPAPQPQWPEASVLTIDGSDDELMTVVVQLPAPDVEHTDFAAMDLIADVLGGGQSGRIRSAFDQYDELDVQDVGAGISHRYGHSHLEVHVQCALGTDIDRVVEVILGELATMAHTGLRAVEWTQARNRALAESIRQVEQLHYYALLQGDRIWHASAGFEPRFQASLADSYAAIPRVARTWFTGPVLKIAVLAPGAGSVSHEVDPREIGYVAREDAEIGRPLPGGGKLEGSVPRVRSVQPPTVTTLENGLTLVHAGSPSTRMFAIHVLVRDRSAREPGDHPGMADLLHRCLPEGAGPYDREEFSALLDGIGAQWKVTDSGFIPYDDYYTTDPRFSFVRLDCVDVYWKEALRLTGLMLGEARFEQDAIDRARDELGQRIRQDSGSSSVAARTAFVEALYGSDTLWSRPVFGREGSLDGIDTRQLQSFALDYLDPGQIVISVVGNVDRQAVLDQMQAVMKLGAASDHVRVAPSPIPLTEESGQTQIEMGGRQSSLRVGRILEIEPGDRWPLEVAVMVASDRMQQELRETRGWAYSLGIGMRVKGSRAEISARMGTRPELVDQAEPALREWLNMGRLDASEDEIAAAVNSNLGRARMRRVTSIGQAFNLGFDLFAEGSLGAAADRDAGLRAVNVEDVARVSELYFRDGPLVSVVVR